MYLVRHMFF